MAGEQIALAKLATCDMAEYNSDGSGEQHQSDGITELRKSLWLFLGSVDRSMRESVV